MARAGCQVEQVNAKYFQIKQMPFFNVPDSLQPARREFLYHSLSLSGRES